MKILFFIALFANICLFLWEFFDHGNSKATQPLEPNPEPKQILLVSELTPAQLEALKQTATLAHQSNAQLNLNEPIKPIETIEDIRAPITITPKANETFVLPEPQTAGELPSTSENPATPIITPIAGSTSIDSTRITSETSITQTFCYEAGPFTSKRAIQKWLDSRSFPMLQTRIITKMDRSTGKYMVYYPAAETYELSQEHIKQLKDLGIKNLWFFREGEDKGHISLGLGSDYANAVELQQKFQKKGITTLIKKHLRIQPIPTLFVQIILGNAWPETIDENDRVTIKHLDQCQL